MPPLEGTGLAGNSADSPGKPELMNGWGDHRREQAMIPFTKAEPGTERPYLRTMDNGRRGRPQKARTRTGMA